MKMVLIANHPFMCDLDISSLLSKRSQEKIVASCSKRFVVIADYRKKSAKLGQAWKKGVPVEVIPMAYVPVTKKIEALGGKVTLRMAIAKAGPVVTDNGGFILDVDFGVITDPALINSQLRNIVGVIETGLFVGMAERAYIGLSDGSIEIQNR